MAQLNVYSMDDFKTDVKNRFFPRQLIVSKKDDAFDNAIRTTLGVLNENIFYHRIYEFAVTSGKYIDLTQMTGQTGIEVKKIYQLIPADDYYVVFENYRLILGRTVFTFNLLRNQDDFIDYLLSMELFHQLNKRYKNTTTDYVHTGDKVLLGYTWEQIQRVSAYFLPRLKLDESTTSWELYDIEAKFVMDYLEALISYREGRAQGEMKIMDLTTNASELKSDGYSDMDKILNSFRKKGFMKLGKVF